MRLSSFWEKLLLFMANGWILSTHTPGLLQPGSVRLDFPRFDGDSNRDAARCNKGLCYNCDEKFARGHRCKARQLFLLEYADDNGDSEPPDPPTDTSPPAEDCNTSVPIDFMEFSYHAMAKEHSPTTLRLRGMVRGSAIQILIDSGMSRS